MQKGCLNCKYASCFLFIYCIKQVKAPFTTVIASVSLTHAWCALVNAILFTLKSLTSLQKDSAVVLVHVFYPDMIQSVFSQAPCKFRHLLFPRWGCLTDCLEESKAWNCHSIGLIKSASIMFSHLTLLIGVLWNIVLLTISFDVALLISD